MTDLAELLAAHHKYERANAAARRFISHCYATELRRSDVVSFLRRRRDPLSPDEIERCATDAIERWLSSRANRRRRRR